MPKELKPTDIYEELGLPVGEPKVGAGYLFKTADIAFGGPIVRTIMDVEPVTEAEPFEIAELTKGTVREALADIGGDIGRTTATVLPGGFSPEDAGEFGFTPEQAEQAGRVALPLAAELAMYPATAKLTAEVAKMGARGAGAVIRKTEEILPELKAVTRELVESEVGAIEVGGRGKPEIKVREAVEPPVKPPEELPKYAGSINLERLDTSEEIKKFIFKVHEYEKGAIDKARRGKVSFDETKKLADDLGMLPEKLLKRRKGRAFNAEEALAARQLLNTSADDVGLRARQAIGGSDEDVAAFVFAIQRHIEVQKQVSAVATEAGRALSAFRIPAGPIDLKQRYMKKMIDALGGREVTEKLARQMAVAAESGPEAVHTFIRSMVKPKFKNMVFEWWINSLLSGPTTHIVNNVSNALTFLTKFPERAIAVPIEAARAVVAKGPRQRYLQEIPHEVFGAWQGTKQGVKKALHAFRHEIETGGISKLETIEQVRGPAIPGKAGRVIRIPTRALMAEDEFFKAVNFQAELHSLAYRNATQAGLKGAERTERIAALLQDPSPEMIEKATEEMFYRVFQKAYGSSGRAVSRLRSSVPGLRYIIPFLRTPVNIAKFGLERTPLNFLRIALKTKRGELKGVAWSDEMAKATMGSLVAATVAMYAKEGYITGKGPENKPKRDAMRRQGWQPYSIRIGDKYYSYGRLEPLGMVMGLAADYAEISEEAPEQDLNKLAANIGAAITQNLTNKTYMRGVTEVIKAIDDPQRYGEYYLKNILGTVVPTGVAQVARAVDPTLRRTDEVPDVIRSRIPGASKKLLPRLDLWGRPIEREATGALALSPVRPSTIKLDPIDEEMIRLDVAKRLPSKKIEGVELTPEQHHDYIEFSGQKARKKLENYVIKNVKAWDKRTDDNKAKKIEEIIRWGRSEGKKQLLKKYPKLKKSIWEAKRKKK